MFQVRKSRHTSFRFVASLTALFLVATALAPSYVRAAALAQSQEHMDHLSKLSGKEFEIDFMSMMIQHHESAVEMAKLAPDRANHAEVKQTAQNIIRDQTREITEMTQWLQQWYNATPKTGMMGDMPGTGMGMGDVTKLQGLKGDDFDKDFLTMMRMHHMSAIEMAKLVPSRATHDELKALAQNIISSQTAEIQEFEGWLKTWYGVDVAEGAMTPVDHMPGMSGEAPMGMPSTGSGQSGLATPNFLLAALGVAGLLLAVGVRLVRGHTAQTLRK